MSGISTHQAVQTTLALRLEVSALRAVRFRVVSDGIDKRVDGFVPPTSGTVNGRVVSTRGYRAL